MTLPIIKSSVACTLEVFNLGFVPRLLPAIGDAKHSISFTTYVFQIFFYRRWHQSSKIFAALERAAARGVAVRCILDSSGQNRPNHKTNFFAKKRLSELKIDVRMPDAPLPQHSKLWLIDPSLVFLGSHNISDSSLRNPFELSVCSDSPTLYLELLTFFDRLWNHHSTPWEKR